MLLVGSSGTRADGALPGLLTAAEARLGMNAPLNAPTTVEGVHGRAAALEPPGDNYRRRAQRLLPRYNEPDSSRIHWMVCRDIASSSLAVDQDYLEQALHEGSPHLAERKGRNFDVLARQHLVGRAHPPELDVWKFLRPSGVPRVQLEVLSIVVTLGEATCAQVEWYRGEDCETMLGRLVRRDLLTKVRDEREIGGPNAYRATAKALRAAGFPNQESMRAAIVID